MDDAIGILGLFAGVFYIWLAVSFFGPVGYLCLVPYVVVFLVALNEHFKDPPSQGGGEPRIP